MTYIPDFGFRDENQEDSPTQPGGDIEIEGDQSLHRDDLAEGVVHQDTEKENEKVEEVHCLVQNLEEEEDLLFCFQDDEKNEDDEVEEMPEFRELMEAIINHEDPEDDTKSEEAEVEKQVEAPANQESIVTVNQEPKAKKNKGGSTPQAFSVKGGHNDWKDASREEKETARDNTNKVHQSLFGGKHDHFKIPLVSSTSSAPNINGLNFLTRLLASIYGTLPRAVHSMLRSKEIREEANKLLGARSEKKIKELEVIAEKYKKLLCSIMR